MTILVALLTLVLGAGLGFLSSLLLERHRQANMVAAKVIDVYLELRKQLCERVSELAGLQLDALPTEAELHAKREAISSLYYRFYDFTPKRVLQELNCLYACLGDRENRLYVIRNDELRLAREEDMAALIEDTSLLGNFRFYALVPLKGGNRDARRAASINYQARRVLHVINQDLTIRSLLEWSRSPRK
ncbi:hypothetical protein ACIOEW_40060 [Streptomyces sp. NPDC087901]|uniref:hypothetical protein n=1 Tax=unclassified Streptomyces TaxID=2593676 RepID=UPI003448E093